MRSEASERNARPEIVARGARALNALAIATTTAGAKPRPRSRRAPIRAWVDLSGRFEPGRVVW
jgi:hypothetical protein